MDYALLIRGILAALEWGTELLEAAGKSPEELESYIRTRNEFRAAVLALSNEERDKAVPVPGEVDDDPDPLAGVHEFEDMVILGDSDLPDTNPDDDSQAAELERLRDESEDENELLP